MEAQPVPRTIEFTPSGQRITVDFGRLRNAVIEFLELYADEPLVGPDFISLIGESDGETRFAQLLTAAKCGGDPDSFLASVLSQLAAADGESPIRVDVNGVVLPYHLVLAVLEKVIPGDELFNIKKVRRLEKLTNTKIPDAEREALQRVLDLYPVRLSSHVIRQMRLSPNVAYQYMPFADELDPEGLSHTWVGQFHRGVIEQMYRNRVIFVLNMSCPVYCRFCFRKHKECRTQKAPTQKHVDLGVAYIRECPEIKEIVLTGGDPFMNRPTLTRAVDRLGNIPHVQVLRLATRSLSYHPSLFTARDGFWLDYLTRKQLELQQKGKRIEVATHFIHPDEISVQSLDAISELTGNGVPVYVQTPILGGCNDSGEVMADLFAKLRSAGAEMHYIFMPCSPIQGNARYTSQLSRGFEVASYLRAHLSDRALPHLVTATSIGKIDWGTNGWVVEKDRKDPRWVWMRTPYTLEFFASFAPILDLSHVARENSGGTLDAMFMAETGDSRWMLEPSEEQALSRAYLERSRFPAAEARDALVDLQTRARELQPPLSIVATGSDTMSRPHETRVELDCDATDQEVTANLASIAEDRRVSDVVLYSRRDPLHSPHRVGSLIERLAELPHVTAVRLRSQSLVGEPEAISDGMIKRLTSWNRLSVVRPLRLEVETMLLHPSELEASHARVVRSLRRRGITVYNITPLLAFINDSEDEMASLCAECRRLGIEMHHVVVAGAPIQDAWSRRYPIHVSQIVDISSHLRRTASGRELPRFVVRTELGEVDLGLTAEVLSTNKNGRTLLRLLAFDLEYYRSLQRDFTPPKGTKFDTDGHPIVAVCGLVA
jgi:KamA family protein